MSIEKLSRTAGWTKRLRGVLELFNRCLGVCDDFNEARYAMVDVLGMNNQCVSVLGGLLTIVEWMLQILVESVRHLRHCPTGKSKSEAGGEELCS